jgi:[protein-PII] uridylyltransferase
MHNIPQPRAVIDRRSLLARLDERAEDRVPSPQELVAFLKEALAAGRAEIRRRFDEDGSGMDAAHALSFLMDQLIRVLYDFTVSHVYPAANPTAGERMALVAVGGYGRGELAPYSDVDLLFLLPYKATPHTEQVVEYMLYALWDLGLKVGQSTRSITETIAQAKADLTIRTAILEARYIWGEQKIFEQMKAAFDADIVKGNAAAYVRDKLAERNERHQRLGDSRYVVEPNVKEGKGGLRDLHTLFWIAKFAYRVDDVSKLVALKVFSEEEAARFARAQSFLWTVRCHLHFLAGRAEDRLTFDYQAEIGRRMGYTDHAGSRGVERFMKHYFLIAKDVGDLTRIICAVLESEHKARPLLAWRPWGGGKKLEGFVVEGGRIDVEGEDAFRRNRIDLLRLFHVAEEYDLDIHPHALRLITHNLRLIDNNFRADPEANRLFMEILTSHKDPEVALRRLNEAGVFGRFVPDFGRVVAQMQYDMYHIHTVDEHTIFAIGFLAKIEKGLLQDELPLATSLVPSIDASSRRALYLAVLCHDIAKGRGGDHSILGEEVALKLGPRLGLSAEETETVAWLVRWHLLMSATAFKLDIDDPKTISDFVDRVQSPERLKLLLLLTAVDIRAVGPKVWNGWKATLLRELYQRAADLMVGGLVEGHLERISRAQEETVKLLPDFSRDEIESYVAKGYPFYWLSFEPEAMARHARLIREAERGGQLLTVETRIDPQRAVTEVTVYTADHAGLFSRIAGALALAGANIVDAKILTMQNGMALDTFTVQDPSGGAFDEPARLARLKTTLEGVLSGTIKAHVELARSPAIPARTRTLALPPRVIVNNSASGTHTVIEVNGRDRPGLLFQVTRALTALNLQISSAKISTYGEKVVDVFYVKDLFGHKVEDETRLKTIREGLLAALGDPTAAQNPLVAVQ